MQDNNTDLISYSQKIDYKPENYLCTSYFILQHSFTIASKKNIKCKYS